jgi:hypothetical protein
MAESKLFEDMYRAFVGSPTKVVPLEAEEGVKLVSRNATIIVIPGSREGTLIAYREAERVSPFANEEDFWTVVQKAKHQLA